MLAIQVHAANVADTAKAGKCVIASQKSMPSVEAFCGDQGYRGTTVEFVENLLGLRLESPRNQRKDSK